MNVKLQFETRREQFSSFIAEASGAKSTGFFATNPANASNLSELLNPKKKKCFVNFY